jgi:hypothetical protein
MSERLHFDLVAIGAGLPGYARHFAAPNSACRPQLSKPAQTMVSMQLPLGRRFHPRLIP